MPESPPEYKVYRSRSGLRQRLPSRDQLKNPLKGLRRKRRAPTPDDPYGLRTAPKRVTRGRVLRWIAYAALGWLLLSIVVFFVSAQTSPSEPDSAKQALSPGGSLLTGGPNGELSLIDARLNFSVYGASHQRYRDLVRAPRSHELP